MYAEDFQPEEGSGYKSVSNEQIREQAVKAGVSEDVADKLQSTDYKAWIDAINTYIPKLPEVQHQKGSYKGTFTSPAVVINGTYWDISDVTAAQLSMPAAFTKALGISQDEVGVEGVMPSIGADGKPLPKDSWTIVYANSEEPVEGDAELICDGDSRTYWHSKWRDTPTPFPHRVIIDLGEIQTVKGIELRQRGATQPACVKDFNIYGRPQFFLYK